MKQALIVDDSSTVRMIIAKMLSTWDFKNVQAENGKVAFDTLEKNPDVQIAFVDWNMPVMTGIQFVKLVRSHSKYNDLKLVMVTTETEMPQIADALESGVNEYIMKPFTKDMFKDKLQMLGFEGLGDS